MTSRWIVLFFAASACSWVPHAACHYYRLETGSGFAVGTWELTRAESAIAFCIYSALVLLNLWAAADPGPRVPVAFASGGLHLAFAVLHFFRLARPFPFRVFGYPWPMHASLREAVILSLFGLVSIGAGASILRRA